ncbi:neurexin-1-like [Salvelinus alpinus]
MTRKGRWREREREREREKEDESEREGERERERERGARESSFSSLITLKRWPRWGTISINTQRQAYTAPGESEILDLDDNLYLGGLPENKLGLVFPTEVWTALLNYGYVGCIRDLFIDGQSKDVRRMAEVQKAAGVKPSCSKEPPKQCLSNPCQNNGVCREGWNRYVCDCSGTGYLGRSCERGQ